MVKLWFLSSGAAGKVADLATELAGYLWPRGSCARPVTGEALQLSMEGFALPPDADIQLLSPGDCVRVEAPGAAAQGPGTGVGGGLDLSRLAAPGGRLRRGNGSGRRKHGVGLPLQGAGGAERSVPAEAAPIKRRPGHGRGSCILWTISDKAIS